MKCWRVITGASIAVGVNWAMVGQDESQNRPPQGVDTVGRRSFSETSVSKVGVYIRAL